ncbi:MAG: hypothetical protein PHW10_00690 [Candidatus Peribacteraceae bacterium]|nr:hypothetical protein [Candidatus Peribacteraceae bacterium]
MPTSLSTGVMSFAVLGYAAAAALAVTAVLALLLIPSLLRGNSRPETVGKALYCHLLQTAGIALMTVSGLPALVGVAAGLAFPPRSYLIMLIVFAVGGTVFLWHESMQRTMDASAKAVPALLYHYGLKAYGFATVLLSVLTLLSLALLSAAPLPAHWWIQPTILLAYGLFLSWTVRSYPGSASFQSTPMRSVPPPLMKIPVKTSGKTTVKIAQKTTGKTTVKMPVKKGAIKKR